MRRHLIQWSIVLSLLAPAVAAQLASSPPAAAMLPQELASVRVVVLLDEDAGVDMVCLQAAAKLLATSTGGEMHLIESLSQLPASDAGDFALAVGELPGVLSSELLQKVEMPEIDGCGEPVGVSAQQCTIAFADGTPSEGEWYGQDPLKDIKYKGVQWLSINEHEPALVAVIDTGVDASHPAIASNVVDFGWDFLEDQPGALDMANGLDDDGDGWADEAFGHGTHLSSIVVLVNPDARILPLRVLDADGNGDSFDVADAIYYAVDHGAQVINLSLSMKKTSVAVAVALEYANFAGVSVFASAGNTGKKKIYFPGNYDPRTIDFDLPFAPVGWSPSIDAVTTVAATANCDVKADFSSYGLPVDLVAPGVNIYGAMPGGGYAWWSGTSMSNAVASGAASLLLSVAGPELNAPPQHVLMMTADSVDWKNKDYKGMLGTGLIDALKAAIEAGTH